MLFALVELDYPTPELRRVAALASALDGDVFVLRVLSGPSPVLPRMLSLEGEGERTRLARLGTLAWCERTLRRPLATQNILVRVGDFAEEVALQARALGVACVILGPTPSGWGGTMSELLRACRQPVFSTPVAGQHWAALLAAAKAADGG